MMKTAIFNRLSFLIVLLIFSFNSKAQFPPTIPASNVLFSGLGNTSYTVSWNNGNGSKRIVTIRPSGYALKTPPASTTNVYTPNTSYGLGEEVGGTGTKNYCVYNGTGTSVKITGLAPNTYYYIAVFEYNTFNILTTTYYYFLTSSYGTSGRYTLDDEPTTISSNLIISDVTGTSFKATWTNGNGDRRLVSVREYTNNIAYPADGTGYLYSTVFGNGNDLGTNNYVCYIGTGNTVTVTGLTPGMIYYVRIFDYNGNTSQAYNYRTSTYLSGTATAVNTPPTIAQVSTISVCQNSGTRSVTLKGLTSGGENGQVLTITASSNNTTVIPNPTVNYDVNNPSYGTLYFTPVNGKSGTATITVTVNDNAVTNNTTTMAFNVTVTPLVAAAGSITGTTSICKGITNVSYSIAAVANATDYLWVVPSGAVISGGNTTNAIQVDYPSNSSSGYVYVYPHNSCGYGTSSPSIYVTTENPPTPANAGEDQIVCAGIASMHANKPVYGTGVWSKASSPGSCFINDVNDSLTNVSGIAQGVPAVLVWTISNGSICAASKDTVTIVNDPTALKCQTLADFTSDANTKCLSTATFTFTNASTGASSYTWNFGADATPSSANTVGPHVVSYSTSGTKNISLTINNGVSVANKSVIVQDTPGAAGGITSSPNVNTVCQGETGFQYSVNTVTYASSYQWTMPSGITITGGAGSNVITADYSDMAMSGNITVQPINSCGNGPLSTFSITVTPLPDTSFGINGNRTVCQGQPLVSYYITGGNSNSYSWTLPVGATITFGAATDSIVVNYADTAASGLVIATPVSSCVAPYNTTKSISVTVNELPAAGSTISGSSTVGICPGQNGVVYTVPDIPRATGYSWTLPNGATIISGDNTDSVTVKFDLTASSGSILVQGTNACGTGKASTPLQVIHDSLPEMNICLVSVDSATSSSNEIIWEKPFNKGGLSHFNIYREKTTNVDTLLGTVSIDSLSYFADSSANPKVTSYRYRISVSDTCGNESPKSAYHRTIHLVVNQGIGQQNLQWNLYEGQTVSFYKVLRDSAGTGNYKVLDNSIPGLNTSWSDINPSNSPLAAYRMEVIWGVTCSATAKSFFESRSNRQAAAAIITDINNSSYLVEQIQLTPNPAKEQLTISVPVGLENAAITIYNVLGEVILQESLRAANGINVINVSHFRTGIYNVKIANGVSQIGKKLVIE